MRHRVYPGRVQRAREAICAGPIRVRLRAEVSVERRHVGLGHQDEVQHVLVLDRPVLREVAGRIEAQLVGAQDARPLIAVPIRGPERVRGRLRVHVQSGV